MAGKYCTATALLDYQKDIKEFGAAPLLTTAEQSRAESFASYWIDQKFKNWVTSGWDQTSTPAGSIPPVINEIALAICGSILHRIRNVRDSYKESESDSAAARLWAWAKLLIDETIEGGVVMTASGLQYPIQGRGRTGMQVSLATEYAIENDYNLRSFFLDVELENAPFRTALYDMMTYTDN